MIVRPVTAPSSFPPYRASVKDGYAAIASDGTGPRDVVSAMTAGSQVCWRFGQKIKIYRNHSVVLKLNVWEKPDSRFYKQIVLFSSPLFFIGLPLTFKPWRYTLVAGRPLIQIWEFKNAFAQFNSLYVFGLWLEPLLTTYCSQWDPERFLTVSTE